jgi:hypothetical protein
MRPCARATPVYSARIEGNYLHGFKDIALRHSRLNYRDCFFLVIWVGVPIRPTTNGYYHQRPSGDKAKIPSHRNTQYCAKLPLMRQTNESNLSGPADPLVAIRLRGLESNATKDKSAHIQRKGSPPILFAPSRQPSGWCPACSVRCILRRITEETVPRMQLVALVHKQCRPSQRLRCLHKRL